MIKKYLQQLTAIVGCSLLALLINSCHHSTASVSAPPTPEATAAAHSNHDASVTTDLAQKTPHYFENPDEAKPFPKTLNPAQFDNPAIKKAYQTAQRIPEVLAQQPCYCYCDQGFGHGSLLHCHIDNHSAD